MKYDDERFKQVEEEKQQQLNNINQTYNDLLQERNNLTNQQNELINQWQTTQNENLDKRLAYQQDLINQQKQDAEKAYQKEAKSAYTDYRKENDQYGVSREQQVASGLGNTGYSESSRVNMYNTYQNRLSNAKQSMDTAYREFDNAIREAQLQNDVTKAENALTALQQKLNISLEAFNYKSTTQGDLLTRQQNINDSYYNRYQNVLNQINYEKQQEEAIRQYNENMAYQRERAAVADAQWQKEYDLSRSKARASSGGGSSYSTANYGGLYETPQEEQKSGGILQSAFNTISNLLGGAAQKAQGTQKAQQYDENDYFKGTTQLKYTTDKNGKKIGAVQKVDANGKTTSMSNSNGLKVKDVYNAIGESVPYNTFTEKSMGNQTVWKVGNDYYMYYDQGGTGGYVPITTQVNNYLNNRKSTYSSGGRKDNATKSSTTTKSTPTYNIARNSGVTVSKNYKK